jgi:hypothetical protein
MKEQGAYHIINGAKNALGFTILRWSVWTSHPQNLPISGEEWAGGIVVLTAIVALDGFDGAAKLCRDISDFFDKVKNMLDLMCKGKVHTKWERSSRIIK